MKRTNRLGVASMAAVLVLAGLALVLPSSAGAQEGCDDPYGCPSTTLVGGETPVAECTASANAAAVGARVDVTVTNASAGATITLTLGGRVVDTETAASDADGYADVPFSFVVPEMPSGNYSLVATGPAFVVECLAGTGFQVLAAELSRSNTGGSSGGSGGGGSLARTGFTVGAFLLVAALLITVGQQLRRRAKAH